MAPQARAITESMELLSPHGSAILRQRTLTRLSGRSVERLQQVLTETSGKLLDAIDPAAAVEIKSAYLHPLTFTAIANILGVPPEMESRLSELVAALPFPILGLVPWPAGGDGLPPVAAELVEHLRRIVEHRREHRGDDLLSDLWSARDEGAPLPEQALIDMAVFQLYAGHDNIMLFLGNALLALIAHPRQKQELLTRPENFGRAVEELLRFDGPVQYIQLVVDDDIEIGGETLAKDDMLFVSVGSANRDPERFPEADRLDFDRADAAQHLSFGRGEMRCLGSAVARLDAAVVLQGLLQRFPGLHLDDRRPVVWKTQPRVLRGPESLHLILGSRSDG